MSKKKNHKQDEEDNLVSSIDIEVAPNFHFGVKYFIPEWDDLVDPGYEFSTDTFTPNRHTYTDDKYAHQIYTNPNYDGILVSKVVVDKSKRKKAHIEQVGGIHNFVRFQGKIMGDCGAFGYITEEMPPYTTVEILDYYQHFGFNYGVSIDHLIVGKFAKPGVREKRYNLTLNNAEEFINHHQAGQYNFTPIGVAQGWSPESYAKAVKEIIDMGYKYIALGGLARTPTKNILEILRAVRPHLNSHIRMHLFGVGRINGVQDFHHLGVTSFDSASPLRSAWLDSAANYHTLSGKTYAAVRIPPVDKHGLRVKRVLEAGISSREELKQLEQNSLKASNSLNAFK
ncbi:MAG: queuine/archaeosine tRNA-ribosyltransferase, partial [Symploca sp. SIO1A3]|nr:queuine/archaeosine tRNA-ribosyltransferase [Symploca sp. SIO1A3]